MDVYKTKKIVAEERILRGRTLVYISDFNIARIFKEKTKTQSKHCLNDDSYRVAIK